MPKDSKFNIDVLKREDNTKNLQTVLTFMHDLRNKNDIESAGAWRRYASAELLIAEFEREKDLMLENSIKSLQGEFVTAIGLSDLSDTQKFNFIAIMCTTPEVFDNIFSRNFRKIFFSIFAPMLLWQLDSYNKSIDDSLLLRLAIAVDISAIPILFSYCLELYPEHFSCLFNRAHISKDASQFAYVMQKIATAKPLHEPPITITQENSKRFYINRLQSKENLKNLDTVIDFMRFIDSKNLAGESQISFNSASELLAGWDKVNPTEIATEIKKFQKFFISIVNNSLLSREQRDGLIAIMSSSPIVYDNIVHRNIGKIASALFWLAIAAVMVPIYKDSKLSPKDLSLDLIKNSDNYLILAFVIAYGSTVAGVALLMNSMNSRSSQHYGCMFNSEPIYNDAGQFAYVIKNLVRTIKSLGYDFDVDHEPNNRHTRARCLNVW